ncbi:WLM-domain-containing protein [Xylariaceae sp. FL0662B]|nr:WLM-domain-containing protein [Xylariaceae sp. FL0662B]
MVELDPLVLSFSHLANFPREKDALHTLKKVASMVKPIMRARDWKVKQLTEFYPDQHNLLGLNVGNGQRICLRLRYPGDRNQFLPIEQVVDTMLHELAHNVHGPHDAKFHALWNQLRDEHEGLIMKGYTGEGFLSEGHRLGGRRKPMDEARRLARAAAEKRRTLNAGSGQRLGGAAPRPGQDIRNVIVDAIERRNNTLRGCANNRQTQDEIREIADTATRNGFKTQAEEDAANDAAIAQALWELVQEEEKIKKGDAYVPPRSAGTSATSKAAAAVPKEEPGKPKSKQSSLTPSRRVERTAERNQEPAMWTCEICTLENPVRFLCCDACGTERSEKATKELAERSSKRQRPTIDLTKTEAVNKPKPPSKIVSLSSGLGPGPSSPAATSLPQTWVCSFCGRVRERIWWSCDLCGSVKQESK